MVPTHLEIFVVDSTGCFASMVPTTGYLTRICFNVINSILKVKSLDP